MFETNEKLILASGSPRRQELLRELGVDFYISAAEIEESPEKSELPIAYVDRMASKKCSAVMKRFPYQWVLAADTIVYLEDQILNKPVDDEDAVRILMTLSNSTHHVATSFMIGHLSRRVFQQETTITRVTFSDISEDVAWEYVKTGEPMDKAGAYGIQGKGAFMIREIHGSYTNVVGLPLSEVLSVLNKYGIVKTK